MKINIGENLKKLRLSKDLTQEQLAEVLSVSPQAISRWENNTAYPDIAMLPGIAVFYNTTIDELIGMDEICKTENISKIHSEVQALAAISQVDKAIAAIREGLKLHPNNSGLLLALAETLSHNCNDMLMMKEAISVLERMLQLNDISMKAKSTAAVNLIFLYLKSAEADNVNDLIKSLPHVWESREVLMPEVFDGDDYVEELRKLIKRILVFFCDKIENVPTRKIGETPNYIQFSLDFESKKSVGEMLDMISVFLLT